MDAPGYITSLVHRIKKKDILAMRSLYERYSKEMLATSYRITNDLQESEDILQEAFLDSFEKINQLKDYSKYGSWLKMIIVNKSLATIKKRVHFQDVELAEDIPDEDHDLSRSFSFAELQKVIQELPEGCRQVFSFYLLEDCKHKEIAEMLDISISTSKSQYRYAIKLLRENLTQI